MTTEDKILFVHFISRPSMFITSQDKDNFISFISGYEMGSKTCNFTEPFAKYISDNFKTKTNNYEWIGHVDQLSKKLSLNWTITFKKTTLEFLASQMTDELSAALKNSLKTKIKSLINRIQKNGDPWFDDSWLDTWTSICSIKSPWFKSLWTENEVKVLEAINQKVQSNQVFADTNNKFPTKEMLLLKYEFDSLTINNGT